MTYKNKGPPKRSEGVLQTGSCRYLLPHYHIIYLVISYTTNQWQTPPTVQ